MTVFEKLEPERERLKAEVGEVRDVSNMSGTNLMKEMLHPDCVRITSKHSLTMVERRKDILYENIAEQERAESLAETIASMIEPSS